MITICTHEKAFNFGFYCDDEKLLGDKQAELMSNRTRFDGTVKDSTDLALYNFYKWGVWAD